MLADTCDKLGGMIGPISMLLTGMLIGGADLKKVFTRGHCYLIAALRLIALPALLILGVVVFLVVLLIRRIRRGRAAKRAQRAAAQTQTPPQQ